MLMTTFEELGKAGWRPRIKTPPRGSRIDAILEIDFKGDSYRFAVETRSRAPYPSELDLLEPAFDQAALLGTPLLAAPYVSEGLGRALAARGWSWSDDAGNYQLIGDRFELSRRTSAEKPRRKQRRLLPQGPGALAIIRFLIVRGEESSLGPTELAKIARVTQPRASQVLARLHDAGLIQKGRENPHEPNREELLDAFISEYRGPGGSEYALYSLDPPQHTAVRVASSARRTLAAISADVGPDLVAAWRTPSHLIVYIDKPIDANAHGLTPAKDRSDANVLLRVPDDSSVFGNWHPIVADLNGSKLRLADPTQMIWDLHDLGGDDRTEAAGHLKSWILGVR